MLWRVSEDIDLKKMPAWTISFSWSLSCKWLAVLCLYFFCDMNSWYRYLSSCRNTGHQSSRINENTWVLLPFYSVDPKGSHSIQHITAGSASSRTLFPHIWGAKHHMTCNHWSVLIRWSSGTRESLLVWMDADGKSNKCKTSTTCHQLQNDQTGGPMQQVEPVG